MTPNTSGSAGFLAVPASQAKPSSAAAAQLLAYRSVSFTGTNPELIQFALSLTAIQDFTSAAVTSSDSNNQNTVLQPSTQYNIVMYEAAKSPQMIGSFNTLSDIGAGGRFPTNPPSNPVKEFTLSAQNFATRSNGHYAIPLVFSWLFSDFVLIGFSDPQKTFFNLTPSSNLRSTISAAGPPATDLLSAWGDHNRGAIFIRSPRTSIARIYRISMSNSLGNALGIIFKEE